MKCYGSKQVKFMYLSLFSSKINFLFQRLMHGCEGFDVAAVVRKLKSLCCVNRPKSTSGASDSAKAV